MEQLILFVDDDPKILAAFRRLLRKDYSIKTFDSAIDAIESIVSGVQYPVVISDYKMPQMDGIDFLSRVKELSPESVRLMLSGNADMEIAIKAVNKGHIFRFLTKPIQKEELISSIEISLRKYYQVQSERLNFVNKMAFTLSHEFNNPLSIIKGNIDLLKMKLNLDEDSEERYQTILEQVSRLYDLVKKIKNLDELKEIHYVQELSIYDMKNRINEDEQ